MTSDGTPRAAMGQGAGTNGEVGSEINFDDNAGVIAPPPLIFLSALAVGFVLGHSLPRVSLPVEMQLPIGLVTLGGGVSLMRSFVQAFASAGTPLDPYKPSEAIVTGGPYRFSRNPGYLGMVLTYAGISVLTNSPWALAPLPVAVALIDRGVIAREERYLARKFGEPYLAYTRRVRRWI